MSDTELPDTELPDYVPIPASSLGPTLNEQGYHVGRVERNLFWVTDGTYQSAFLATVDGVVLFDAPPTIGHNLRRAVDEVAAAEGTTNQVTHLVYSHHHADHAGAADLFGDIIRIGHDDTRRLLIRDGDPTRPAPDVTFTEQYTVRVGGERVELSYHGPNHSPDNIFIHFPDHDTLMLVDIVNPGWVPIYNLNLTEDAQGYIAAPDIALAGCRIPDRMLALADQIAAPSASEGTGRRTMSDSSKAATMAKGNRSSSRQRATSSGCTP